MPSSFEALLSPELLRCFPTPRKCCGRRRGMCALCGRRPAAKQKHIDRRRRAPGGGHPQKSRQARSRDIMARARTIMHENAGTYSRTTTIPSDRPHSEYTGGRTCIPGRPYIRRRQATKLLVLQCLELLHKLCSTNCTVEQLHKKLEFVK